jgi:predicted enzyme related to lactoylglutathione lyase
MINRADQGVMAGLTDEVVEIQFGAVPAVIVHIVHRFCSNGGAAVGGLMDGPVRHAPGQCGWAFIFRREKAGRVAASGTAPTTSIRAADRQPSGTG